MEKHAAEHDCIAPVIMKCMGGNGINVVLKVCMLSMNIVNSRVFNVPPCISPSLIRNSSDLQFFVGTHITYIVTAQTSCGLP